MYKVTVEFKTKEEMLEFFSSNEEAPVEEKPKKSTKKKTSKKSAPKKEEEEDKKEEKVEAPVEAPVETKEPEIVQEAPTQPSPGQAAFNRDACLKKITEEINGLQSSGVEGNAIANMIGSIFASLGQAQCKIGELDDSTLISFKIAFDKEVGALKAPAQAAQAGSFI